MAVSLEDSAGPGIMGELAEKVTDRAEPRHPAAVTVDRLGGHLERWPDLFTPREAEAVAVVVRALAAIERGER